MSRVRSVYGSSRSTTKALSSVWLRRCGIRGSCSIYHGGNHGPARQSSIPPTQSVLYRYILLSPLRSIWAPIDVQRRSVPIYNNVQLGHADIRASSRRSHMVPAPLHPRLSLLLPPTVRSAQAIVVVEQKLSPPPCTRATGKRGYMAIGCRCDQGGYTG